MGTKNSNGRICFVVLLAVAAIWAGAAAAAEEVSSFGQYSGYSTPAYDGYNRYSRYIEAEDGTRLAVDYYLPTADGAEASDPMPAILHYTRYIRAIEQGGQVITKVDTDPVLATMSAHGYAVVVADARGTGASFGVHNGPFSAEETADSHAIIEWIAAQDWCDGHVGMHGRSYPGMTQYHAATQAPPHLDAIFPEMAGPEVYNFIYRGGTYKNDFINVWGAGTQAQDLGLAGTAARVDADSDGSLRAAAISEHMENMWATEFGADAVYRNWSIALDNGGFWSWEMISSIYEADAIDASGVAVYHLAGFYDIYTTQQPFMFANLVSAPQKMVIGPWVHSGGYGRAVHLNEFHRWYDYWLKGVDNGIMDEKPVHYYVNTGDNTLPEFSQEPKEAQQSVALDSADGTGWQSADDWPPKGLEQRRYYFQAGPSGSVNSTNDGGLGTKEPSSQEGADMYTVDYTCTSGAVLTRWKNGYGGRRPDGTAFFDERTAEDRKGLTYTTEPLEKDLIVTGHPVVHLFVTSTHDDGDFFVYLEEIDGAGRSHYISEGALRASYRAISEAPFANFGLPHHRAHEQDLADLPSSVTELVFDIMGTSVVFDAGHRIRITVTGADKDNYALYPDPEGMDAPTVAVHRTAENASFVDLTVQSRDEDDDDEGCFIRALR
jgi:hypothetical protein